MAWLSNIARAALFLYRAYRYQLPARMQRLREPLAVGCGPVGGLGGALVRWGCLLARVLNVLAFGEWLDLFGALIKPNSRPLTELEIEEARRVFGDSIHYEQVQLDERSLLAWLGAKFRQWRTGEFEPLAVVIAHRLNFSQPIHPAPGNKDMAWLIHELTHVAQMEVVGLEYYPEALYAQFTEGYDYGGLTALEKAHLCDFNREQQADIMRDFYFQLARDVPEKTAYFPLVEELRQGQV
ncbi:MAG: hypothetical protein GXP42_01850 [Chloroflexi bacterium]|nr:hypothetical protein [Chloroflexota bacterium]